MKKKIVTVIILHLVLVLLSPIPMRMRDGGTVQYTAILYQIEDVHRLNPDINSEQEYIEGIIVRILGIEVYNNIDSPK